jgi:uncharacterized protein YecT (DUF1311 family)
MRPMLALYGLLLFTIPASWVARSQRAAPPRETLTHEQQEYQRDWREYMAKRPSLQAHANQIFDTEMAREKAGDCPNAVITYDINVCLGKQVGITEQNLKQYEAIIRELIASAPEEPGGPGGGPAGPALTSAQSAAEFDNVEQAWYKYRNVACKAARDQMGGGSAAPSSEMHCDIDLDRSHMRELDSIYWLELHK